MNKEKLAKLEAAGFVTTTVEELLGLSPEEMQLIELRLQLAKQLKEKRLEKNLSQTTFAKQIGSSQSRVAKMEKGDPSVSMDLLIRSLFSLDVDKKELGALIAA